VRLLRAGAWLPKGKGVTTVGRGGGYRKAGVQQLQGRGLAKKGQAQMHHPWSCNTREPLAKRAH